MELFSGQDGFVIKVPPPTPEQIQSRQLYSQAQEAYKAQIKDSTTLADFIFSNRLRINFEDFFGPESFIGNTWEEVADMVKNPFNTDEYLEQEILRSKKDAELAEDMRDGISRLPVFSEQVAVALRRIRPDRYTWNYRILAQFSPGQSLDRRTQPVFDVDFSAPQLVLFSPKTACVMHASDDLFKQFRKEAVHLPYRGRNDALARLQVTPEGATEYQLIKTESEIIKQEAWNYVLVGLQSGFGNEPDLVPVSDFWNRPKSAA